ncbi:flagellar basal-body rod modification protein FlgD [Crenobacter luteus]|uniref:Basal-body rod modification protein FlgD n=1 Tax=Crenobacter luteus TaxID=1452487 RepID=A0A165F708_9NEIS|nr:flagellar hook capping FlgD N-terminal domain-containing protein [Crenobacter luteus]KZE31755.1 flagellar biosynthesis protein FlgD [Crenobacter luteus]TCP15619.1 flagellar basal-body rod modification protein FlgD [Crenobacter luteus]
MTVANTLLNGRSGANATTQVSANGQSQAGVPDMFMTLLMAQIKNQSPLDPADPSQFVNQLVQMNQMQSSLEMLAELKGNALMLRELQGLALGGQVGGTALVATDVARLDGSTVEGRVTLSGEEGRVALRLTGADGQVTLVELGAQPAGELAFRFKPSEHGLAPGVYQIAVETASKSVPPLELAATIQGVRLPVQGGEPVLTLSGLGDFPASSVSRLLGHTPSSRA